MKRSRRRNTPAQKRNRPLKSKPERINEIHLTPHHSTHSSHSILPLHSTRDHILSLARLHPLTFLLTSSTHIVFHLSSILIPLRLIRHPSLTLPHIIFLNTLVLRSPPLKILLSIRPSALHRALLLPIFPSPLSMSPTLISSPLVVAPTALVL